MTSVRRDEVAPRKTPSKSRERFKDRGDETARNYRYQHSYGVILLAAACRGNRPYAALWCEHHEDFLVECTDGSFEAWQIKTRRSERGFWTVQNAEFVNAVRRFATLPDEVRTRTGSFCFASNTGFLEASEEVKDNRRARSPTALLIAVQAAPALPDLGAPFNKVVCWLADRCDVSQERIFETLARCHLVVGPSRGEMDASLSNEHLARVADHAHRSAVELAEIRDALVARIARASSLHVTDPARHLHAVTQPAARSPAQAAKRVGVEAISMAGPSAASQATNAGIAALHVKFDDLVARLSGGGEPGALSRDQVRALLDAFSELDVDPAEAMHLLLRKAEELRTLQATVDGRMGAGNVDRERFTTVFEAFKTGDFDAADAALERLATSTAGGRDPVLIETVQLYVMRAHLALARFRYDEAADHFGTAAAIAGVFDKVNAFRLLGEQAQIYVDKALLHGGRPAFQRAFEVNARRIELAPENSEERMMAIGQHVAYLGVASERAPAPEAQEFIALALGMGQPLLKKLDAKRYPDAWIMLANTIGAVLSNGSRLASMPSEARAIAEEAIDLLTRAAKIARPRKHPEISNIETNLATAYRRLASQARSPAGKLRKAILYRRRALEWAEDMTETQLGNAFDSLGNDYSALAEIRSSLDLKSFRSALASYRRALSYRPKKIAPIDWARTQFNISNLYGRACRLSAGEAARRYSLAALARSDRALSVLDQRNAPHDWSYGCFQMALIVGEMLDADLDPPVDRIRSAFEKLADVGAVADGTGDLDLVIKTLNLQAGLTLHIFSKRHADASAIIASARLRLAPRLSNYRYTPLRIVFGLADAQFGFMLAHLGNDASSCQRAIAAVEALIALPATEAEADYVAVAREVLDDMRAMAAEKANPRFSAP